jgi:hypothetical protein
MFNGRTGSTETQPAKTRCDWILFQARLQIKEKSPRPSLSPNVLAHNGLAGRPFSPGWLKSLFKTLWRTG